MRTAIAFVRSKRSVVGIGLLAALLVAALVPALSPLDAAARPRRDRHERRVEARSCINPGSFTCPVPTQPPPAQPDLVVSAAQFADGALWFTVRNAGTKGSGPFAVRAEAQGYFLLDGRYTTISTCVSHPAPGVPRCTDYHYAGTFSSPGLAAGASQSFSLTVPGSPCYGDWDRLAGSITADAGNAVAESYEGNNSRSTARDC